MQEIISEKYEFQQITPQIKSSIHNINEKNLNHTKSDKETGPRMYDPHSNKILLKEKSSPEVDSVTTKIGNFFNFNESEKKNLEEGKKNNNCIKSKFYPKEVSSPTNPMKTKTDNSKNGTLCEKMPNFLKNYEDILKSINSNSQSPNQEKNKKQDELNSKIFEASVKSNRCLEFDKLSSLITSTGKKPQPQNNPSPTQENTLTLQSMTNTEEIKDFYEYTESCMKRIVKLKVSEEKEIEHLMLDLPFSEELKKKRLAVFDLDETLVHCESRFPEKGQVQIKVNLPDGTTGTVYIYF